MRKARALYRALNVAVAHEVEAALAHPFPYSHCFNRNYPAITWEWVLRLCCRQGQLLHPLRMAIFAWHCPTYGCRGLIIIEEDPGHDSRAVCQRPSDSGAPACGREMCWDAYTEQWHPTEPFKGFSRG
jgi:hypothetical protein